MCKQYLYVRLINCAFQVKPGCIAEVFNANDNNQVPHTDATHGRVVPISKFVESTMVKLESPQNLTVKELTEGSVDNELLLSAVVDIVYTEQEADKQTEDEGTADDQVYKAWFTGKNTHMLVPSLSDRVSCRRYRRIVRPCFRELHIR